MAEAPQSREQNLREHFHSQTAKIPWRELQTHYARGAVVQVSGERNLVEVAVQLGMDNTELFEGWIRSGDVAAVGDEQALAWFESDAQMWAVVAAPWVLVQAVTSRS